MGLFLFGYRFVNWKTSSLINYYRWPFRCSVNGDCPTTDFSSNILWDPFQKHIVTTLLNIIKLAFKNKILHLVVSLLTKLSHCHNPARIRLPNHFTVYLWNNPIINTEYIENLVQELAMAVKIMYVALYNYNKRYLRSLLLFSKEKSLKIRWKSGIKFILKIINKKEMLINLILIDLSSFSRNYLQ